MSGDLGAAMMDSGSCSLNASVLLIAYSLPPFSNNGWESLRRLCGRNVSSEILVATVLDGTIRFDLGLDPMPCSSSAIVYSGSLSEMPLPES